MSRAVAPRTPAEGRARGAGASDTLLVHGGRRLRGAVDTAGFKHSLVTVVAAAAAARAEVRVANCPDLAETEALAGLVSGLGGRVTRGPGTLTVDASDLQGHAIDEETAGSIHGSVYLAPALLARHGAAVMVNSGGCRLGDGPGGHRPIEQYVDVFRRFGARLTVRTEERVVIEADRLTGCEIDLLDYAADRALRSGPLYSGACKTAVLCAAVAHGTSVLHHLYPKPDVTDLVNVLRALGADIETFGEGSLIVRGRGPESLDRPTTHTLLPDLIEVVTWMCAGALLGEEPIRVRGEQMGTALRALRPETEVLERFGVRLDQGDTDVVVHPARELRGTDVTIASHGVFSDSQPFLALLATHARGASTIRETVWNSRFGYVEGLTAMGAAVRRDGASVTVEGLRPPRLPGRSVHAPELRSAAMLLLAALGVPGTTEITGTHHLARGYPDLVGSLGALGARIERL
ncbi:UDP-N-acetylglucosamine 1-carboxyvinyltransferase [Streptomyces sp. WZ.A104]|uniref:UDP-N-acetylglucosamine 1-carboxyvinyltransferase n=1 Tax=Streptomyces sp. WZ.A104 TaxID=2023771 RepID=UPI0015C890B8|nr:hypothetical protein [Streptomyces sp. WZ.A104]